MIKENTVTKVNSKQTAKPKALKKVKSKPKETARPDCYHDPVRLLKTYRGVRWNLKLSVEQHRREFELEYGMSITDYLDDVYTAGADFSGTKLHHHANGMKRTAKMLGLIDTSIHLIRENYSEGEAYYWIIYYTYLSPQKLSGVDEIVDRIKSHLPHITRDTYFKQRKKAIDIFASVLWGFTTKGEMGILDAFFSEDIAEGAENRGDAY